jgi:hypothetical protein
LTRPCTCNSWPKQSERADVVHKICGFSNF